MIVASYPKSGLHLVRRLLRGAGVETTHTHNGPDSTDLRAKAPTLHVIRDVRDIVVSAVCYFVLERPEMDPELIRPHVLDVADAMRSEWRHAPGSASWTDYVLEMSLRAKLTVTFRDLIEQPAEALSPLDVSLPPTHNDYPPSWERDTFRRGVAGGWRDVLTPTQAEQIMRWHAAGMLVYDAACLDGVRL